MLTRESEWRWKVQFNYVIKQFFKALEAERKAFPFMRKTHLNLVLFFYFPIQHLKSARRHRHHMQSNIFTFTVRCSMLNTRMHFCMNIPLRSEIDCICEQTKQTFVSLKYSINTSTARPPPTQHSLKKNRAAFL